MFKKKLAEISDKLHADMVLQVTEECQKLVKALFDVTSERVIAWHPFHHTWVKTVRGEIMSGIGDHIKDDLGDVFQERLDEVLSGEEFIDKIVERILKKQIRNA